MKKISILLMLVGIISYFGLFILEASSGKQIYSIDIPQSTLYKTNEVGPIDFRDNSYYRVILTVRFNGRLESNYTFKLYDRNQRVFWSSQGKIKGETKDSLGHSTIYLVPFKYEKAAKNIIQSKLSPSEYECEIDSIDIGIKKGAINIDSIVYNIPLVIILTGLIILFLSFRKK